MKLIEQHFDKTSDDYFYYLLFQSPTKQLKQLLDLVGSWRSTRLTHRDVTFEKFSSVRREFTQTIFCQFKQECNGICKHPLLQYSHSLKQLIGGSMDIYTYEEVDPNYSLDALIYAFNLLKKGVVRNKAWTARRFIKELEDNGFVEFNVDAIHIHKLALTSRVKAALAFQSNHCDIFNEEKMIEIINIYEDPVRIHESIINEMTYSISTRLNDVVDNGEVYEEEPLLVSLTDETIDKLALAIAKVIIDTLK